MAMTRTAVLGGTASTLMGVVAAAFLTLVISGSAWADPPEGQSYTGLKKCASCHFKQFMAWKKTKHAKSFDLLPSKYQKDAKCLQCHTTGYGEPSGFKDKKSTPNLAGGTCEVCHGPGSEHAKIAEGFGKKKLSEADENAVRDSIWLMLPKNVCVECHKVQAHGKSETPKALRRK